MRNEGKKETSVLSAGECATRGQSQRLAAPVARGACGLLASPSRSDRRVVPRLAPRRARPRPRPPTQRPHVYSRGDAPARGGVGNDLATGVPADGQRARELNARGRGSARRRGAACGHALPRGERDPQGVRRSRGRPASATGVACALAVYVAGAAPDNSHLC